MTRSDLLYLRAAQGWITLGNMREAHDEWGKISRAYPENFDYLQVLCRFLIQDGCWESARKVALRQLYMDPDRPEGWINQAYCLHELKRTREARHNLISALRRFPNNDLITYNLACYSCHLQRYAEALRWTRRTISLVQL